MATQIFNQENAVSAVSSRGLLNLKSSVNAGKVFGSSGSKEKTLRKALGNVNSQLVNKKAPAKKSDDAVKKPALATKKTLDAGFKPKKQSYPEIEKIIPYNPEDFESFDVSEEHQLSNLCLAGLPLVFHENGTANISLDQEPSLLEIPVLCWESEVPGPSFLTTLEEITLDLPQW